jgi:hypothetical protein
MDNAIRAAKVAAILLMCFAIGAFAQSTAPISFDQLPRRQKPDTGIARLRGQIAAQRDSIARLRQLVRSDTLYISRVDTVHVSHVDTVKIITVTGAGPAVVLSPTFAASGLTQVMFASGDATKATYRLRRVEVKMTADLGSRAQAVMMVDVAKSLSLNTSDTQPAVNQSSRVLQDAFISMPVRKLTIDAGQQRLPLGYEGSMGASSLETVERALMESDKSRGASFGDVRDAGVIVRRSWTAVEYRVGLFNGSGETMNEVDKQVGKAVVARLALQPVLIPGLRIGVSAATSGRGADDNPTRDRIGADLRVARGPLALQLEGMAGQDGPTHRVGYYALTTYALRPRLTLVSRVDVFDPDLDTDVYPTTVGECDYVGGFSWLPAGTRLKVQLNVVHKTYTAGLGPSSTLVLTQLQASW